MLLCAVCVHIIITVNQSEFVSIFIILSMTSYCEFVEYFFKQIIYVIHAITNISQNFQMLNYVSVIVLSLIGVPTRQ